MTELPESGMPQELLLGEFRRTLDERYRLAIPEEFHRRLDLGGQKCVLAKERAGCISLWNADVWQAKVNMWLAMATDKIEKGLHDREIGRVQLLGRLLSTRHQRLAVTDRGRVLIPKGFRDFLGVEPKSGGRDAAGGKKGHAVMIVGAAVCVEIWNPNEWLKYLRQRMPNFRRLVQRLS